MKLNKQAPARQRAKAEYLLTTKLYCGYCKSMMIGHSSNQISTKGVIYNYYKCKNSGCQKAMQKENDYEKLHRGCGCGRMQKVTYPEEYQ